MFAEAATVSGSISKRVFYEAKGAYADESRYKERCNELPLAHKNSSPESLWLRLFPQKNAMVILQAGVIMGDFE